MICSKLIRATDKVLVNWVITPLFLKQLGNFDFSRVIKKNSPYNKMNCIFWLTVLDGSSDFAAM